MASRSSIEAKRGSSCSPAKVTHESNAEFVENAQQAIVDEKNITFLQPIKLHPKAVGWSILLSTAIVMEGYDLKLILQTFAQPEFARTYGQELEGGDFEITAPWQAGLSNAAIVGSLFGYSLADRWLITLVSRRP